MEPELKALKIKLGELTKSELEDKKVAKFFYGNTVNMLKDLVGTNKPKSYKEQSRKADEDLKKAMLEEARAKYPNKIIHHATGIPKLKKLLEG